METKQKETQDCETKMNLLKEQITKNDHEILHLKQTLEEKLHGDWYAVIKLWEESGHSPTTAVLVRQKVPFAFVLLV